MTTCQEVVHCVNPDDTTNTCGRCGVTVGKPHWPERAWIKHEGNLSPVPNETIVEIKDTDGKVYPAQEAGNVYWRFEDWVAYRVAEYRVVTLPQTDKTTGMQELVVVPKYSPEDIERIAGVVLRAAGSDFKNYMPSSKELILAELTKVLTEKQEKE